MLVEIKAHPIDLNSNVGCFLPLVESHLLIDGRFEDETNKQNGISSEIAERLCIIFNLVTPLQKKYLLLHVVPTLLNISRISLLLLLFLPLQSVF